MKPRVLALCAGYGGLELALASVEDIELVAYAEYDDAPARIMAHHHPDVPNLRDVTKIDWHALLALGITIMTAGYPCQPFSHAGKRQGEDDPRHLWPHIAKGIGILRPALLIFENVRGHLSLGLDQVLLDLDGLGYDVRVYLLKAADVGAAHGRARIFIFAEDRAQRGPVGLPSGSPVAEARDGRWFELDAHLFGIEPFEGKLPGCSRLVDGVLYAEPAWTTRDDVTLLPTPTARDEKNVGTPEAFERRRQDRAQPLTEIVVHVLGQMPLLPTPAVNDMGEGKTVEAWDAWTDRMKAEHGNGNGHGKSLAIEAQRLLPTPRTSDTNGAGAHGDGGPDLRTVVEHLLPTPSATDGSGAMPDRRGTSGHGPALRDVGHLLPTPTSADSKASGGSSPSDVTLTDAVVRTDLGRRDNPRHLLPTPRATRGGSATESVALLPTPRATDGTKGGPNQRGSSGDLMLPSAVQAFGDEPRCECGCPESAHDSEWVPGMVSQPCRCGDFCAGYRPRTVALLPTPRATRGGSGTETSYRLGGERTDGERPQGVVAPAEGATWGDYGPAIARWETVTGRPAPAPTELGAKGGHRLSPRFVEWLMGLPDGWVCDVPDITRNQALKALGNGVVWQQAAAAYRAFLADTEKEKSDVA